MTFHRRRRRRHRRSVDDAIDIQLGLCLHRRVMATAAAADGELWRQVQEDWED